MLSTNVLFRPLLITASLFGLMSLLYALLWSKLYTPCLQDFSLTTIKSNANNARFMGNQLFNQLLLLSLLTP